MSRHRRHPGTPLPTAATARSPFSDETVPAGGIEDAVSGRTSVLRFSRGSAAVRFHPGGILRLTLARGEPERIAPSCAVTREPETLVPSVEDHGEVLELSAGGLSVRFTYATGDFELRREPGDARLESRGGAFRYNRRIMGAAFPLGASDALYGLGEKTGFLDKRGRVYEMWNTDEPAHFPTQDPLYVSVPFFIRSDPHGAVGVFLDETARSWFDLGKDRREMMSLAAASECLDLYIIVADQVSGVVERYSALTGRMDLPPVWALGFGQSRYSYIPDSRVVEVAETLREKGFPADSVYLDIDYMDGFRVFTWDPVRFPDPKRLAERLAELGFRIVTIVDPGVRLDPDYQVYRTGLEGDHFCRRAGGEVYEGAVWAGPSAFPDFTQAETRDWWAGLHDALLGNGVSGIWNDMNEPADFTGEFYFRPDFTPPADVTVRPDGLGVQSLERYHNVYGHNMCRATARAFERYRPDERAFVLTRAAFSGTQRYAAVWTGDNHSWWEHLAGMIPMVLNLGLSGFPFVGADVGGFQADAEPELYARWIETAAFMPFFRAHSASTTGPHEPWSFGSEVEQIARRFVELRYSLLPYMYGLFAEAARHGAPVVRPLLWHYPEDRRARNLNDEFLLGRDLLVAPVLTPGAETRAVYLPEGQWYDFRTDSLLEGPTDVVAQAPLESLPVFVRAPSVIPMAQVGRNAEETLSHPPTLHVYPGTEEVESRVAVHLHHDDGHSKAYRHGEKTVREVLLTVEPARVGCGVCELQSGYAAAPDHYRVVLHGGDAAESAAVSPGGQSEADWVWFTL